MTINFSQLKRQRIELLYLIYYRVRGDTRVRVPVADVWPMHHLSDTVNYLLREGWIELPPPTSLATPVQKQVLKAASVALTHAGVKQAEMWEVEFDLESRLVLDVDHRNRLTASRAEFLTSLGWDVDESKNEAVKREDNEEWSRCLVSIAEYRYYIDWDKILSTNGEGQIAPAQSNALAGSVDNITTHGGQFGVIGNHVTVQGSIHFHGNQAQPPEALVSSPDAPTSSGYDLAQVQALLNDIFTEDNLRNYCLLENPDFRPVHDDLKPTDRKSEIIRLMIDHADRKGLVSQLLAWAKDTNPNRYGQGEPYEMK